jgi:hypothetical protein
MNFEKMPNPGEEKENKFEENIEKNNENEVEEINENEIENSAEKEMSKEQFENVKEDINELESLSTEFEGYSEEEVEAKIEKNPKLKDKLKNALTIATSLGVVGSLGAGMAMSGGSISGIIVGTAGVLTTAIASAYAGGALDRM